MATKYLNVTDNYQSGSRKLEKKLSSKISSFSSRAYR